MAPAALHDPSRFPFVARLEAAWQLIQAELLALERTAFQESPDSLTTIADGYNETGWQWYALYGGGPECAANRERCPTAAAACEAIPGLRNAGFSRFLPGTHLYPHCGEMTGVLRCHLPLLVPVGHCGLRFGGEVVTWQTGRCLVFDDTFEHEAWNHTEQERVVLLATFAAGR
jgi:ornithine lipid ester-linked acyl 2-hydroxylase